MFVPESTSDARSSEDSGSEVVTDGNSRANSSFCALETTQLWPLGPCCDLLFLIVMQVACRVQLVSGTFSGNK
jgi:hypothetical protein